MPVYKPKKNILILAAALIVLLSALLSYFAEIKILYAHLISINLITLLFYGCDKHRAKNDGFRIPEIILHLLALAGGSPGALAGQLYFRHKTKKWKFLAVFAVIVIIQIVIIGYWFSRNASV